MGTDARGGPRRRRVVIIGAGFGGLTAARELGGADVQVTLIDRHSHRLFQPLLYQVACGGLSAGEIAAPIRRGVRHARNVSTLMASVTGIDAAAREVELDSGERIQYDSLVVACGAETSYFGEERWRELTFGLKTLEDALRLRDRVYGAFEEAERAQDDDERRRWQTFVVVGGGPTGVEFAGELSIIARHAVNGYYSRFDPSETRVVLVDAGPRVTAAFSERLSGKVAGYLADLGVTIKVGARVTAIDENGVEFSVDGASERVDCKTVVWAAGVQTASVAASIAASAGAETDRAGRLVVGEDLAIPGHPEITVLGDAGSVSAGGAKPLPGLATVAIQQAHHVVKGIRGGAPGAQGPFRYFDKGALAVVGRGKAVCEIRGREISGRPAFFTYLTVHMAYLSGGGPGHRLKVLIDWISARFGSPQEQVIRGELPPARRAHVGGS
ncbi:MAG TPA: NAD(P)/FAD-dependent oxidoreductase [Solirubrobacteraceae bacterium]|nr:NAD(P)/FAD-dependent oxidoreductase [Solirubrobacteraceae bacterium]